MSLTARLVLVLVVVGLAALWAVVARRGSALRRKRVDAPPGVELPTLFASEACGSCSKLRHVLSEVGVTGVSELVWEREPEIFDVAGVDRVPVFFWSDRSGTTWRFDGVASAARLRRWIGDP